MKKRQTKKTENSQHVWKSVGISVVVLLIFTIIYLNYTPAKVGQAITIGNLPYAGGVVDLGREGSITLTILPSHLNINFTSPSSVNDPAPHAYLFSLNKLNDQTYSFSIYDNNSRNNVATDILSSVLGEDKSTIYLNNDDAIPDLEVAFVNGQIVITNLYSRLAGTAVITFVNTTNSPFPSIIRLAPGTILEGTINASSAAVAPIISVNKGLLGTPTSDSRLNLTSTTFAYTAPAISTAEVLEINATVMSKTTRAYYTLAIGNIAYALQDPALPNMTLQLTSGNNASLNVNFPAVAGLQPFAIPCAQNNIIQTLDQLFQDKPVKAVYSYDQRGSLIWTKTGPNDFNYFEPMKGYFVELNDGTRSVNINLDCEIRVMNPAGPVPGLTVGTDIERVSPGWSLLSWPGLVPQALTDFTMDRNFHLYECGQNYQCGEVLNTTPLTPGKPYWIFTTSPFSIQFVSAGTEQ